MPSHWFYTVFLALLNYTALANLVCMGCIRLYIPVMPAVKAPEQQHLYLTHCLHPVYTELLQDNI